MRDNTERNLKCSEGNNEGRRPRHCEMREQTVAYSGQLNIDGRTNGGVSVKGWSRADVLVRAKVDASAESEGEARSLASQVRVDASAGRISASGPDRVEGRGWSVSYEVFVPHSANLQLTAHNGGVHVADVGGQIEFTAVNGGVHLARLSGHVQGRTQNGGLHIELTGSRWDGEGMDVTTTNGGVHVQIPASYSAHLETSTVNGGVSTQYPMTVSGKIGRQLSANLGSGGATIRLTTTNGGIKIAQI
ncbi:MAG: DUF4097 family beta strand repeat protein [Acidobacteria bacterium]|nr:DUF4097 family beta strand repeat protein [Acidobacteriota bacterium]